VLRRPRPDDLPDYLRLHSDPRTYAHAPDSMPSPERCRERLTDDLADWERDTLGYAAVLHRASRDVIGWAGLRRTESDGRRLNLYYRLAHDRLGAGFGREIARALVAWGSSTVTGGPSGAVSTEVSAGAASPSANVTVCSSCGSDWTQVTMSPTRTTSSRGRNRRMLASFAPKPELMK